MRWHCSLIQCEHIPQQAIYLIHYLSNRNPFFRIQFKLTIGLIMRQTTPKTNGILFCQVKQKSDLIDGNYINKTNQFRFQFGIKNMCFHIQMFLTNQLERLKMVLIML